MLVKVNEASGQVLDWLVCVAEYGYGGDYKTNRYSSDWSYGGPIIDRMVGLLLKRWLSSPLNTRWQAEIHTQEGDWIAFGPSALIAVMRCYVLTKLGEEVDVPEELLCRT